MLKLLTVGKVALTLLSVVFCVNCIAADKPDLPHGDNALLQNIAVINDGMLDGSPVFCFVQDSLGLMWYGTENGLYSYDEHSCVPHFTAGSELNTRINSLISTGDYIYICIADGLYRLDLRHDKYEKVEGSPMHISIGLKEADISPGVHSQEILYLGTTDGVYIFHQTKCTFEKIEGLDANVMSLAALNNRLMVGSTEGLYEVDLETYKIRKVPIEDGAGSIGVCAMDVAAKDEFLWIGTERGLFKMDKYGGTCQVVEGLKDVFVRSLKTTSSGAVLVGTDEGLFIYVPERQGGQASDDYSSVRHYVHDSRDGRSIRNNIICSLFQDRWDNVWIGTENGVSLAMQPSGFAYMPMSKLTDRSYGNCIRTILMDSRGDCWLGGTNGLIHLPGDVNMSRIPKADAWFRQKSANSIIPSNRVSCIYEDQDGDVWITTDNGVSLYDRRTRQFRNFEIESGAGDYTTRWAHTILMDRSRRLWISAYMGGIFIVEKQKLLESDGHCISDTHLNDVNDRLAGLHAGKLVMDKKGNIYAHIFDKGVDYIDYRSLTVTHIDAPKRTNDIGVDGADNLWCAFDGGIDRYNPSDKSHNIVEMSGHGRPINMLSINIVKDEIWAISAKECHVLNNFMSDVMVFNIPMIDVLTSYFSPLTNSIVLGADDAIMLIDPEIIRQSYKEAGVVITDIRIDDKSVLTDSIARTICKTKGGLGIRYATGINLSSGDHRLSLQFSDIPYSNSPSAKITYSIDGLDDDIKEINPETNTIDLNRLPGGQYRLRIYNNDDGDLREVYSLDIRVSPRWYASIYAVIVYCLLCLGLVYFIFHLFRIKKRLEQERGLLEQDKKRSDKRMESMDNIARKLEMPKEDANGEPSKTLSSEGMPDNRLLNEIIKIVDKNIYDSNFNVSMLQETLGVGDKMLYRKMKQLTGQSPVEFIRKTRMKRAATLLEQGQLSVSEIMYMVGFTNNSYFSKCFQKEYGMTPTEYARRNS